MTKFNQYAAGIVVLLAGANGVWAAPPPPTNTVLELIPATVTQFGGGVAKATVSSSLTVSRGKVKLYQAKMPGGQIPSACLAQDGGAEIDLNMEAIPVNGVATFDLGAAGLTATVGTIGYIVKFTDSGADRFANSQSGCLNLQVVTPPVVPSNLCPDGQNAVISTTLVTGPGAPIPGVPSSWTLNIAVRACKALTSVSAQGGENAWAGNGNGSGSGITGYSTSTGSVGTRKETGGKNQVQVWTIGAMAKDQTANLTVIVNGTVKGGTACGKVLGLLGSWSVTSTSADATNQKSEYAGPATVTVGGCII